MTDRFGSAWRGDGAGGFSLRQGSEGSEGEEGGDGGRREYILSFLYASRRGSTCIET